MESYFEMRGYAVDPARMSPLMLEDLEKAGTCPAAKTALERAALARIPGDDGSEFVLLNKSTLYANSGNENMLLALRDGEVIPNTRALSTESLRRGFAAAESVLSVYASRLPMGEAPVLEAVSVNVHDGCADPEIRRLEHEHGRKLSVQTVTSLHLHTLLLTSSDMASLRSVEAAELSREERDNIHDPTDTVVSLLFRQPEIAAALTDGIGSLRILDSAPNPLTGEPLDGLSFSYYGSLGDTRLASDIQHLHENLERVYGDFTGLYAGEDADTGRLGSCVAPLFSTRNGEPLEERFIARYFPEADGDTKEGIRFMVGELARSIGPVESALSSGDRVLIDGLAYTLSFLHEHEDGDRWTVNVVPRLVSTGNLKDSLGYVRRAQVPVSDSWWDNHDSLNGSIRGWFGNSL